jgi:hypothetical protein
MDEINVNVSDKKGFESLVAGQMDQYLFVQCCGSLLDSLLPVVAPFVLNTCSLGIG